MSKEAVSYSLTSDRIKKTLKSDDKKAPKYGHLEPFKEEGIPFEGEYDFGGDVEGAIEKFGADVVYNHFRLSAGLQVGARVRDLLQAGKNDAEIQAYLDGYKIGVKAQRASKKDPRSAYKDKLMSLSPEEREAEFQKLLAELDGAE